MTRQHLAAHPAKLAIAAFLAFGSTPLLAQEAITAPVAPQSATPVVIVPPTIVPAAQSAPTFAPTAPIVQATPSVEESKAAAIAASQAETPAPSQRAAPRATERTATPATPTATTERAATPAPIAAAPVAEPAPATPAVAPTADVALPATAAEPTILPATAQGTDPALYWALGGAALVLLGIGGTAAMRRRRKSDLAEPVMMEAPATVEPRPAPPVMTPAPVLARPSQPALAAAPAHAMTDEQRTLENMVAAAPSRDNPFLTHAKRTRRAKFLLAQRNVTPVETPVTATATPGPVDRSQTVYSFGPASGRTGFLKPRTT